MVICVWLGSIALWNLINADTGKQEDVALKWVGIDYNTLMDSFIIICVTFFLYEYVKLGLTNSAWTGLEIWNRVIVRYFSNVYTMNLLWGIIFLWTLSAILGNIGVTVYSLVYIILLIGNIIKIVFHNTLLTPLYFMQLSEAFRMAETVLGTTLFFGIIIVFGSLVVFGITAAIVFCKRWIHKLKVSPLYVFGVASLIICISFTYNVITEQYKGRNIFYKGYANEYEKCDGFAFYNLVSIAQIDDMYINAPARYGEAYTNEIKQILLLWIII